jgi:phage gp16-like protein
VISKKQIALVHVAKARCGLSDVEYRDLLGRFGVSSSKELTPRMFNGVMQHFKKLGFEGKPSGRIRADRPPANSKERLLKKIEAIRGDLGLTAGYVDAIARNMFQIDCYVWCEAHQLHKIVAALTYHQQRKKAVF